MSQSRLRSLIISQSVTIEDQTLGGEETLVIEEETHEQKPAVARSTAIMSMATLLSRITGFIRMWATALALGATAISSSYNIANNVPNMIFELVAGGILSSLFIPTFMDVKKEQGEAQSWRFASHVFNIFVLLLGIVALVGTLFPEPFIWTQTFRMTSEKALSVRATAEFLFRFFAIQVVLYGGGMVIQAVLNAQRRYLWTALGPVFNNVVVIVTMLIVATQPLNNTTLIILASGTTLGVAAMFLVMLPSLRKTEMKYYFEFGFKDPAVRRMVGLALPGLIYVITNLITVSFRNASALGVAPTGPAVLTYAWTWYQLPYGILAVALATALFTELSEYASNKDKTAFKITLSQGLRQTALLIIPCAGLLFALATPLTTLFMAGRFTSQDVPAVAGVLRAWALALTFYACMMFVLRSFYSLKDTKTPAVANIATSLIQIAGYSILTVGIGPWHGFGLKGIPYSDLIFCFLQFSVLLYLLRRKIGSFDVTSFVSVFVRMIVASAVGALACSGIVWLLSGLEGIVGALIKIAAGAGVGLVISFGIASLLRVKEVTAAKEMFMKLGRKLANKKVA